MSVRSLGALAALVRWRGFTEARASDTFRQSNSAVEKAKAEQAQAERKLDAIQQARFSAMQESNIDLSRLQLMAQMADVAEDVVQENQRGVSAAQEARQQAQDAYLAARAQTRVAASRSERLSRQRGEIEEKLMFDRMADLYTQARRR